MSRVLFEVTAVLPAQGSLLPRLTRESNTIWYCPSVRTCRLLIRLAHPCVISQVAIRNSCTAFFTLLIADELVPFDEFAALVPCTQLLRGKEDAHALPLAPCKPRAFRTFPAARAHRLPVQELVLELAAFYDDPSPHVGMAWIDFLGEILDTKI